MKRPPDDLATRLLAHSDQFLGEGPDIRIDRVAEVVDVPRATLYYYFSGKDDLLSFLMTEKMERVAAEVGKARAGEGRAIARFETALRAVAGQFAASPSLCLNLLGAVSRMDAMGDVMMAADRAVMAPLRELLVEARADGDAVFADAGTAVAGLVGGMEMAVINHHLLGGQADADALCDQMVATFLDGIRSRD